MDNSARTKLILKEIFLSSLKAVQPRNLLKFSVSLSTNNVLHVYDKKILLKKPCYIVGFGKAVQDMALYFKDILKDQLANGIVLVPANAPDIPSERASNLRFIKASPSNLPDKRALDGAIQVYKLLKQLQHDDVVLVLVSGGGSALLPLPRPPITLEEKRDLCQRLINCGICITQVNCVRKHISLIKGGGLADAAYPATVISLVLSDVIGDLLESIAGGPTAYNNSDSTEALQILTHNLSQQDIPPTVLSILQSKSARHYRFDNVYNFIIGNNRIAVKSAQREATKRGFAAYILSTEVAFDVSTVSEMYIDLIRWLINGSGNGWRQWNISASKRDLLRRQFNSKIPICFIAGGEPTIKVLNRNGIGGRNQHLVLDIALKLHVIKRDILRDVEVWFLSAGTDGIDGSTDAAGAICNENLIHLADHKEIDIEKCFRTFNSFEFFSRFNSGTNLVKTGYTGTNVMDIQLMLVFNRRSQTSS